MSGRNCQLHCNIRKTLTPPGPLLHQAGVKNRPFIRWIYALFPITPTAWRNGWGCWARRLWAYAIRPYGRIRNRIMRTGVWQYALLSKTPTAWRNGWGCWARRLWAYAIRPYGRIRNRIMRRGACHAPFNRCTFWKFKG